MSCRLATYHPNRSHWNDGEIVVLKNNNRKENTMSILGRMVAERNKLLAEAKELDKAIALINKFKSTEQNVEPKKIATKNQKTTKGAIPALHVCVQEAILKYGRPVSREEIFQFLPSKGFTTKDFDPGKLAKYLWPKYVLSIPKDRKSGFWPAGKPIPEPSEWQETLKQVKVI